MGLFNLFSIIFYMVLMLPGFMECVFLVHFVSEPVCFTPSSIRFSHAGKSLVCINHPNLVAMVCISEPKLKRGELGSQSETWKPSRACLCNAVDSSSHGKCLNFCFRDLISSHGRRTKINRISRVWRTNFHDKWEKKNTFLHTVEMEIYECGNPGSNPSVFSTMS